MSESWTDPASLEGDELARWYLRSPAEIEQACQAAADRRYQDFFFGLSGTDPDSGIVREAPALDHDVDPGIAVSLPSTAQDVDPGITWVPAGPNRFRSVRLTTDGLSADPSSSPALMSYADPVPVSDPSAFPRYQDASPLDVSAFDLMPKPGAQSVGELRTPPPLPFGSPRSTAAQARPRPSTFGGLALSPVASVGTAAASPEHQLAPGGPRVGQTIAYGALRAPAPSDQELADLRRQQAAFADTTRKIDMQNSWFAVPALAPPLVALGLGAAGAWATGEVVPEAGQAVANFTDREAWPRGAQKAAQALSDAEKNALRAAARMKFARANGISASEMQAEVHHSDPLEWTHLKPDADPNRLANLWGLRKEAHTIATREWAAFTKSLEGRVPSRAELMEAKLRIDRLVEPYIRRAGLPRSNRLPGKGGPL